MTISLASLNLNSAVSLNLDKGAIIDLEPSITGVQIEVECGNVWVTQEGDQVDHQIGPSGKLLATGNGLIVIQALTCSKFRVHDSRN